MPLYHLGRRARSRSTDADVTKPSATACRETLPEWIRYNGLTHLKIKLNGDDLGWDVERVAAHRPRHGSGRSRRAASQEWFYSLDFNERCPNVDYLLEFLRQLKETSAGGVSSASSTSSSRRPAT